MKTMMTIVILFLSISISFAQFFTPSPAKSDFTWFCFQDYSNSDLNYWEVDSIGVIDLNSAFSLEVWQFIPSRQNSTELLRIYCQDTSANFFRLFFDSNFYLQVGYETGSGSLNIDTQNERGTIPKEYSGVFDVQDWYHIVYAFDGNSLHQLYINGNEAVFSNSSGVFQSIYGDYVIRCWNIGRVGPVRFFQKQLSAQDVRSLWNEGTPKLSTTIDSLKLEYTHAQDTWTGTSWIIDDSSDSNLDGETTGFNLLSRYPITDFEPDQLRSHVVTPNTFFVINGYFGHNYYNGSNGYGEIGPIGPYQIEPSVFYDSATNKTLICVLDRVGLGANMEGVLLTYDHTSDFLSEGVKNKNNELNGIVDTHQGMAGISIAGKAVTTQERQHNSELFFNTANLSDQNPVFGALSAFGPDNLGYPNMQLVNGDIYTYARNFKEEIYLYKSSDLGGSWTGPTIVGQLDTDDWFYPQNLIHPSRLIIYGSRRDENSSEGGGYTDWFFIQSDDGINFYNADSSYSKSTTISDSELESHYKIREVASFGVGQIPTGPRAYGDGKIVNVVPEYITNTDTVSGYLLLYANEKDTFQTKSIPASSTGQPIHISGDTWDYVTYDGNNIDIYRTTDFFNSLSLRKRINGSWIVDRPKVTANPHQASEIIIICQVKGRANTSLPGTNDMLGIYIYPKE